MKAFFFTIAMSLVALSQTFAALTDPFRKYKLQKGDTCQSVAAKLFVDVEDISRMNKWLHCRFLNPGLTIVVPAAKPPKERRLAPHTSYKTLKGDTCADLARMGKFSVSKLVKMNPALQCNSSPLKAGIEVTLPVYYSRKHEIPAVHNSLGSIEE
jgi:LysM repeat protein